MNNYIFKIAKNNIKKDHKLYQYIFLSIFMTFFIVVLANVLISSLDYSVYLQNTKYFGKWDIAYLNAQQDQLQSLEQSTNITNIGKIFYAGEVKENNQYLGYIGYYDEEGLNLANLQIIEGEMAVQEDEIVVEETIQKELNLALNQEINLHYSYDNQDHTHQYKLVGVVKDYSSHWLSRGLSFITTKLDYHEIDVLAKAKHVNILWNENGDGIKNNYLYPEYKIVSDMIGYTNESHTLQNMLEILIISTVVVIATMMSSLNKRESQFVMLRSIGMTYKQLQRLIVYEGVILAIIAGIGAILLGVVISLIIMFICSLGLNLPFALSVSWISLLIEILLCAFVLTIGIILPTLTVYDLPLTRRNGEFTYHSHKQRIKKPTFFRITKDHMSSYLGFHVLVFIVVAFMIVRGTSMIENINDYYQNQLQLSQEFQTDYIWIGDYFDELKALKENEHIHIYSDMTSWINIAYSDDETMSSYLVCIQNDNELKDAIEYSDLGDNEALILCTQKYDDILFDDIKVIVDYDEFGEINNQAYQSLKVSSIVDLGSTIQRYYLTDNHYDENNQEYTGNNFVVVVNENTYKNILTHILTNDEYNDEEITFEDNYFSISTDRDIDRIQIHDYLMKHIQITQYYDYIQFNTLINVHVQNYVNTYGIIKTLLSNNIYSFAIFMALVCILYLMKLLFSFKIKKELGILNVVGMTKKKIYLMHILQATFTYIFSLAIALTYWYVFSCEATLTIFMAHLKLYLVFSLFTYFLYILSTILPLIVFLKQNSLDLINERIQ